MYCEKCNEKLEDKWNFCPYCGEKSPVKTNTSVEINLDSEDGPDVRNVNWGMSKELVLEKETAELMDDRDDVLIYECSLLGYPSLLIYKFNEENQLYFTKYAFKIEHSNRNDFIIDYLQLQTALSKKYGEGTKEDFWVNDLYQDSYEDHGFAISLGHRKMYTTWEFEGWMSVFLYLLGDNYEINMGIEYSSKTITEKAPDEFGL